METIEKQKLVIIDNKVFVYINEEIFLPFIRIFHFPGNSDSYLGHMNIWDDYAPFYFLWTNSDQEKRQIKGYNKCYFLSNTFRYGYDKNNKMYLRFDKGGNIRLVYHNIRNQSEKKKIDEFKSKGRMIFEGYAGDINSDYIHGEAIELIDINK